MKQDIVHVDAARKWNPSALTLEAGQKYRVSVSSDATWKDWFVTCGPEGYTKRILKPLEFARRAPKARWFSLIATIERGEPFLIGRGIEFTAEEDGTLEFYANDLPFMYWNNSGSIAVQVDALSE